MRLKLLFILALAFVACKKDQDIPQTDLNRDEIDKSTTVHNYSAPDSFKAGIGKIYSGYLKVQQALAADDFKQAQDAFSSMHGIIHIIQADGLDSAGKAEWDSGSSRIMMVLHPMATSKDIGEMREHLMAFTPLLVDVMDKFGMNGTASTYLFHCPMAQSGKGADWLQKDKNKANPYQGKAMPDCGNLVKEIKP